MAAAVYFSITLRLLSYNDPKFQGTEVVRASTQRPAGSVCACVSWSFHIHSKICCFTGFHICAQVVAGYFMELIATQIDIIHTVAIPRTLAIIPDTPDGIEISSGIEGCSIRWVDADQLTGIVSRTASTSSTAPSSSATRKAHPCECRNRR